MNNNELNTTSPTDADLWTMAEIIENETERTVETTTEPTTKTSIPSLPRGRGTHHWLRINIEGDADAILIEALRALWSGARCSYIGLSLAEFGDNPKLSSYGKRHRHLYLVSVHQMSKLSIYNHLLLKKQPGQWWIEETTKPDSCLNRITYMKKQRTKTNWCPTKQMEIEYGSPPGRQKRERNESITEETGMSKAELWKKRKQMARDMEWDDIVAQATDDTGFWLCPIGKSLYAAMHKQVYTEMDPSVMQSNFIIIGAPGTGKSLMCDLIRREKNYYKWNGEGKWFAGYVPKEFNGIIMEEMDLAKLKCLGGGFDGGMQRLKVSEVQTRIIDHM